MRCLVELQRVSAFFCWASLVDAALEATNATSPKQMGQVMGFIMKTHRDQVDASLVRTLIEEALSE